MNQQTNKQTPKTIAINIVERYLHGLESLNKTEKTLQKNNTPLRYIERGRGKVRVAFKIDGKLVIEKL